MTLPKKSLKFSMLFPDSIVLQPFLSDEQLVQLRAIFEARKHEFKYGQNEDGSESKTCRTQQLIEEDSSMPWLNHKFRETYHGLCEQFKLSKQNVPALNFNKLYLKFYFKNDFYGKHVDISHSNLTFLFQFCSQNRDILFSDLVFENGERIPFKDNQLIIFQSSRPHFFDNESMGPDSEAHKCIVQCLPEIIEPA